ncbi:hypothetical protein Q5530_11535 [Saccharothrix sp. BKS2]|uniref:hypothetical protein n=1 Tax=Saccharothrix sp. BKS2 TaxID=3064400 RepID=UPI0039E814C8
MSLELSITPRLDVDSTSPFWHRDQPTTSAFRVDPGYAALRAAFPVSWSGLVEVKSLLDCYAMVDSRATPSRDGRDGLRLELARRVAGTLWSVAEAERASGRAALAETISTSAELFALYSATGEWKPSIVEPPTADEPWFYCGRLGTWSPRTARDPLSLLVVVPDPARQRVITDFDARFGAVTDIAGRALGAEARLCDEKPDMHLGELVLAGGESAFGHKNFAHFFPLETPGNSVLGREFTVVFGNVFQERVRRCSLPLLGTATPVANHSPAQLVDSLLVWFRGHDLGHFWRRADRQDTGAAVREELGPFLAMALEETYADSHGILVAAELADRDEFGVGFCAEHIRYLSRRTSDFADSVAATLELGWLTDRGITLPANSGAWLDRARPAVEELVRTVHAVLWEGDRDGLDPLFDAIAAGRRAAAPFEDALAGRPTDLSYVFA